MKNENVRSFGENMASALWNGFKITAYTAIGGAAGAGLGYLIGKGIDYIPYVNGMAPAVAEKLGLIKNTNDFLYMVSSSITGGIVGFTLPIIDLMNGISEREERNDNFGNSK